MDAPEHRWDRICEIFEAASEIPVAADRQRYVSEACGTDVETFQELMAMLNHEAEAQSFLAEPHPALRISEADGPSLQTDQVLCNRFRIVRFIGRGGMGEVYEAFDNELAEPVALKTVRPDLATPFIVARFKTEIQLARRITHPNVCRIFDLAKHGTDQALHFLTMELLHGESLADRLRQGPLPKDEALNYAGQIIAGLSCAHNLGIVHRDIKPGNIMLVPSESGAARAVLMDFGLAHSLSASGLTANDPLGQAGTPFYMAPEQYSGGEISVATDIYAFGVIFNEMLTGSLPSGTDSLTEFVEHMSQPGFQQEVSPMPGLDRASAQVILRCLQRDPKDRYQTCDELGAELFSRPLLTRRRVVLGVSTAAAGALGIWGIISKNTPAARESENAEANQDYQKGRLHGKRLTTDDLSKAIQYFDSAIRLDPKFALAHSGRADAYSNLTDYGGSSQKEAASEALRSAKQAVALAPQLAEAHNSLGLALASNLPQWRSAERPFRESIRLDPRYAYAHHCFGIHQSRLGLINAAIESLRKAIALDPVSMPSSNMLGFTYYFAKRYSEAIAQGLQTVDLDPTFFYGYLLLARAYTETGEVDKAGEACEDAIRLHGNRPVLSSALGCIRLRQGRIPEARDIASSLERQHATQHFPALYIASLHARLHNNDAAFAWLNRGWDAWESSILLVGVYPHFEGIRADSRYRPLMRRFDLPS